MANGHKECRSLYEGFTTPEGKKEIWIFGFGSLIWKPGFNYSKRIEGYIKGYRRVFYQGSTDHRGTPSAPGRTVTLEEDPGGVVPGAAFLLAGDIKQQQKILEYLEWREKQYDVRRQVAIFNLPTDSDPVLPEALVYIATSNTALNANYLGPASPEDIARQIAVAVGPSGPNTEYLHSLVAAVRKMGIYDEELEWLEARVREISLARG